MTIKKNSSLLPGILKSTKGGYDGHLSYQINSILELDSLDIDFSRIHILEKKVNFIKTNLLKIDSSFKF